ncbi:MAG: extracellular solute-binding protein [Synechococcaceae cyanobacterium SM2_3_1]|nr:extracellular solute-binding protein [Synechococcaceae cyanobacterium SM2_3_1]
MPERRWVLQSLAGLGIGMIAGGSSACGADAAQVAVRGLKQSIPSSLLSQIRRESPIPLALDLVDSRLDLWHQLHRREQEPVPNWQFWQSRASAQLQLTLLGSDWLDRAIQKQLISPLRPASLEPYWSHVPQHWQRAVTRESQIWGIPWRWGVTAIAYNRRFVTVPIQDWADLWHPQLQRHLTLPDHPREVIGLTQKALGRSYNTQLNAKDPELLQALARWQEQVLAYTSNGYLQMLRIEDSWAAVGWTEDLYQLQQSYPEFEIVIPASGSVLWWDLWVVPGEDRSAVDPSPSAQHWLNRVLDPEMTPRFVNFSQQPSVIPVERDDLDPHLQERALFQARALADAELWGALTEMELLEYLTLWERLRTQQILL